TMPAEPVVFVRPNLYAPGRAHIVVYNWGHAGAVPVDVAAVLRSGDAYLVRSVQALFDPPLVSGVYTGGSITVPMSPRPPPVPVGLASSPAPATLPEFDVFLVTRAPRIPGRFVISRRLTEISPAGDAPPPVSASPPQCSVGSL